MKPSPETESELRRIKPALAQKFGVKKLAWFDCFLALHHNFECELNILVELEKPLGWEFFALKEYLEWKLQKRIDICTERSIKPLLREEIVKSLHYV